MSAATPMNNTDPRDSRIAALESANKGLVEALRGDPEMPASIGPLSWLRSAIDELERRGPAEDDEDPAAYREMVDELRSFNDKARAALAQSAGGKR